MLGNLPVGGTCNTQEFNCDAGNDDICIYFDYSSVGLSLFGFFILGIFFHLSSKSCFFCLVSFLSFRERERELHRKRC